jgi:CRP-like cAMP-binding protein
MRQLAKAAATEAGAHAPVIRITHEEISRLSELSRQTVTTILGEMQRNGILKLGLRSIVITSEQWLATDPDDDR